MVGSDPGGVSDTSRRDLSSGFGLAVQRVDVDRARARLDKYENHFGICFLFHHNAYWDFTPLPRKGSYGAENKSRFRQLPYSPKP
jgi:hypothetical protein